MCVLFSNLQAPAVLAVLLAGSCMGYSTFNQYGTGEENLHSISVSFLLSIHVIFPQIHPALIPIN